MSSGLVEIMIHNDDTNIESEPEVNWIYRK